MNRTLADIFEQLEHEDLVPRHSRDQATRALAKMPPTLPWYARGVTGFFGWLAAACFAGWAWHQFDDPTRIAVGLLGVLLGIALRRRFDHGYLQWLSLALCLGGEGLAIHAMHGAHGEVVAASFALGLELLLLVSYPDVLMRLLCTIGACTAVYQLHHSLIGGPVDLLVIVPLGLALLLLHHGPRLERRRPIEWVLPVTYGLVFASLALMLASLEQYAAPKLGLVAQLGIGALLLIEVGLVLRQLRAAWYAWPLGAVAVGTLVAFSFASPGILAALTLLAAAYHARVPRLLAVAASFLTLFYLHLYFQLDGSLLNKSMLMAGNGLSCLLVWRLLSQKRETSLFLASRLGRRVLLATAAGALLVINGSIVRQELVLRTGDTVLVDLFPADPRSLMQGDYMALRTQLTSRTAPKASGNLVVKLDGAQVASFVRFDDHSPLGKSEHLLRYRQRREGLRIGAESYFFQEGDAAVYRGARYGELKVTRGGHAVLVGLMDGHRNRLGRGM